MGVYGKFAAVYSRGDYPDFSRHMADYLPAVLKQLSVQPVTLLDLACGEGTFAVAMAGMGFEVTGIDASRQMIRLAGDRAAGARARVNFVIGDMRTLSFNDEFDLVTCWYDSLNYLLDREDLSRTFEGVSQAIKPGGIFIFDMNTIYGLATAWREAGCYVKKDSADTFEVHRHDYDFESAIAKVDITCFVKSNRRWKRFEEEHKERGYSRQEVLGLLRDAGFQPMVTWGSLRDMSDATDESERIWYIAKR